MLAVTPPSRPEEFKLVLDELTEGLMNTADGPLLAAGENLWLGLAGIIVVWHGARTALSGEAFNAWETIKLIIVLSIPRGMLEFYATPFPGLGLTFPQIIVEQGSWLNGIIVGDTGSRTMEWLQNYLTDIWATLGRETSKQGLLAILISGGTRLLLLPILAASSLLTLIVVLVGYCYILFAQIAISILTLFGPLFIPWIIFGPLSFLFWSWFRMMLTYSLYAAVAAAVFRVMMQLIMTLGDAAQNAANFEAILADLEDPSTYSSSDIGAFILWSITYVLALLTSLLATFKIPEIAGGLVSGAAPSGGIAGAAITAGAAVKGGAAVGKVAGKATGG